MGIAQALTRLQPPPEGGEGQKMNRVLTLFDLVGLGVGSTIGAGVYLLSGKIAVLDAGPAVTLCFLIAAVASILSGVCYAELGCRVPRAGSGYSYLYATLGEGPGFAMGWCLLLSYLVGTSSVASALITYLNETTSNWIQDNMMWPKIDCTGMVDKLNWPAVIVIILLAALMCVGVEEVSKVTNTCLAINLLTILTLVILCGINMDFTNWSYEAGMNTTAVPKFFDAYYNTTSMVEGSKPEDKDGMRSFVQKYCLDGTYVSGWYKGKTEKTGDEFVSKWYMNCTLSHYFRNTSCEEVSNMWRSDNRTVEMDVIDENGGIAKVKTSVTDFFIDIPTNYYFQRRYPINPANYELTIEDSYPGTGGYVPFSWSGVSAGASSCFYGFLGFDVIATTGEEAINPQKNIPMAIIIALAIICAVYLLVSGTLTLCFPYFAMNKANPFAGALAWNGYGWITQAIRVGAICALTASLIGAVLPMPRILWNMAEDGLVYSWFSQINPKTKVPQNATITVSILAAILALLFDLDVLIDFMTIATLLAFAMVACCVLVLRYRGDNYKEQGSTATKVVFGTSLLYFIGFILTEKILPLVMAVEGWTSAAAAVQVVIYVFYGILAVATIACMVILARMEEVPADIAFKVPFLPYFPLLSIAVNFYLMASLGYITWIQLVVWLFLGSVVYFTYGINHSLLALNDQTKA